MVERVEESLVAPIRDRVVALAVAAARDEAAGRSGDAYAKAVEIGGILGALAFRAFMFERVLAELGEQVPEVRTMIAEVAAAAPLPTGGKDG